MSDLISRRAAIEMFDGVKVAEENCNYDIGYNDGIDLAVTNLSILPSAQPEPKWIPVSERLPKNDDWVIITVLDERGDTPFRYTDFGWYLEAANCWIVDAEQRTDVTAWMPLPEPWKGEEDE